MNQERWQAIEALFHRALDLDPIERAALLQREAERDLELSQAVEKLILSETDRDDVFSQLDARQRELPVDPMLGRSLGVYRLHSRLATGGMGTVYAAERCDGLFEQEVAIKLIRAELADEVLLRRFEFERRTLAALTHPSIARLIDGGTSPEGCPYFVMERVYGESIDRYCERARLSLPARLGLFLEVCRAVHYAHQNLVVHCDLKPANILIDQAGRPRLLDFGIARLLEDEAGRVQARVTQTSNRMLTPEYASPEQLAGQALTTSVDVYALGVVLYELLTGRRPFDTDSRSPAEWERIVREQAPAKPSTRVVRGSPSTQRSTTDLVAASLDTTPARLRSALRGDLDRIVLMALRKEPGRRYGSVQALAEDIERHLDGRAIRARSDSWLYVSFKFVGRHRVAVAACLSVVLALVLGLFAAWRGERRAQAEARHARIEADSFQSIADFLMDAFLPAQPDQDSAFQARAQGLIRAQAERVERQYAQNHHQRANLLDTLGTVSLRLELFDDAIALHQEAASIRARTFGETTLEYALSLRSLGKFDFATGQFAQAAQRLEQGLEIQRDARDDTHSDVASFANDLAATLRNLGRESEAEALHREALAIRRQYDPQGLPVAESLNNLAAVHLARGELESAGEEFSEALDIRSSILGDAHVLTLQTLSNLASAYWQQGRPEEARKAMLRSEAGYRQLGGDGEQGLSVVLSNLATMAMPAKDHAAAEP